MLLLWCWEQLSIKCWRYKIQCIQKGNLIVLCSMQKLHQICPIQWGHIKRVKDTSIITSRHRNDCNNWTPDQVIAFIGEDRTGIVVYWTLSEYCLSLIVLLNVRCVSESLYACTFTRMIFMVIVNTKTQVNVFQNRIFGQSLETIILLRKGLIMSVDLVYKGNS